MRRLETDADGDRRSWSWTRRFIVAGVGGTANKLPRLVAVICRNCTELAVTVTADDRRDNG